MPTIAQKEEFEKWLNSLQQLNNDIISYYRYLYSKKLQADEFNPEFKFDSAPLWQRVVTDVTAGVNDNRKYYAHLLRMPPAVRTECVKNVCESYQKFFASRRRGDKRAGAPRYKSVKNPLRSLCFPIGAIRYQQGSRVICLRVSRVTLDKESAQICQFVKFRKHKGKDCELYLPNTAWFGEPRTARIIKEPTGKWYIVIVVEDKRHQWDMIPNTPIGIDLNLTDDSYVTLSNGKKYPRIRHFDKMHEKLAKEQRKLNKKQRAWKKKIAGKSKEQIRQLTRKNYEKQRIKVAKVHKKIFNMRDAFQNNIVKDVVLNHSHITAESLNLKAMMSSKGNLGKSFSDAAFGYLKEKLKKKCAAHGREYQEVNPRNTSQMCSSCGHIPEKKKGLSVRSFICENCGEEHDRDVNAAVNILKKSGVKVESGNTKNVKGKPKSNKNQVVQCELF
jgi:IS605 OrfB family transposase